MTNLHRAGLAGLYLTLWAFEDIGIEIPGLEWELEQSRVTLKFTGDSPHDAFNKLTSEAFQIDENGMFYFPGLDPENLASKQERYHLYEALKGTFLQFGPHCKTGAKKNITYEIDDKLVFIKNFAPLESYKHQNVALEFLTKKGFANKVSIKGWLFPGGIEKHSALTTTCLQEPPELAICLLFTPIGVVYYRIDSSIKQRKARTVVVIPEVHNLEEYHKTRSHLMSSPVLAAGSIDAGLHYLKHSISQSLLVHLEGDIVCTIITFGIVTWNEKQKSRTHVRRMTDIDQEQRALYEEVEKYFKPRWILVESKVSKGEQIPQYYFNKALISRELIAENIAVCKPWYWGFAELAANRELRKILLYERKELGQMMESEVALNPTEKLYVQICHEAWRRRLGKLGQRAQSENADFGKLVRPVRERLRVAITKAKTVDAIREVIVDFWARAGSMELLQDNWEAVISMFEPNNWRKARDLALLALISYKPESKEQEEALSNDSDYTEEVFA